MPKTSRSGRPKKEELPDTIQHSSKEAQEIFAKARESAVRTYGEGQRAYRTAYSALKHKFEKRGDRWVRRGKGKGPGGVDVEGSAKKELYERAADLDVRGRSKMSKEELAEAIARKQG